MILEEGGIDEGLIALQTLKEAKADNRKIQCYILRFLESTFQVLLKRKKAANILLKTMAAQLIVHLCNVISN